MRLPSNQLGLLGLLFVAVYTTVTIAAWAAGPHLLDVYGIPLGLLARWSAAPFTPAPGPTVAGTARQQLSVTIFLAYYLVAAGLFARLYWQCTNLVQTGREERAPRLLAVLLVIGALNNRELLYFIAVAAAYVLAPAQARRMLVAIMAVMLLRSLLVLWLGAAQATSDFVLRQVINGLGYQVALLVAFGIGHLAAGDRRGRQQAAGAHAELLATQQLLAETVRASERLRIARDLHDSIGHHLTALNLHLDLALRKAGGDGGPLRVARELAQNLLAEVRTVVGAERAQQAIDLPLALRTLCAGIPKPRIELSVDAGLAVHSPAVAQAVFHAVQEALTNAVRHAGARRVRIEVRGGGTVTAVISDDGRGLRGAAPGNGLAGLRERVHALGGSVTLDEAPEGGCRLSLSLPA